MTTTVQAFVIQSVAGAGTTQGSAASISYTPGRTIVLSTKVDASNFAVRLPSGAAIGDSVEVYNDITNGPVTIFPPTSETFYNGNGSNQSPNIMTKVSSTQWSSL